MNIGEAADASSLTPDTIRFYEKKGILPRPPRLASGYRHYTEEHVATLRLAKALRELESPLAEVAPILSVALAFRDARDLQNAAGDSPHTTTVES